MVSRHYKQCRSKREKLINKHCNGDGKIIDSFIVDKGHKNGLEKHCITDTGIVIVYNLESGKFVTKIVARPQQIKRYYEGSGKDPPRWLMYLAEWHKSMNYNNV